LQASSAVGLYLTENQTAGIRRTWRLGGSTVSISVHLDKGHGYRRNIDTDCLWQAPTEKNMMTSTKLQMH